ncbi:MAG TPA: ribonuclease E inhibitor RraB [Burkholderiales bacterium]|nr:ribonuclease E inhibitor RraB [Burkholderiales bacterium]
MFANMRAKAPWNIDGPLLWGYFFLDPSREKLEQAAGELQSAGYRVVGIAKVQGQQRFRLHVERVEIHTPATLDARNQELYAFADRLGLASYDGMDVGPVQAPNK